MERRLDALDQRLATTEKNLAGGAQLRDDVRALGQRLDAAEAKVTQALATAQRPAAPSAAAPGAGAAAVPPAATLDPSERRAQLAALMTEYRRRLSSLGTDQGAQGDPADRMMARRSLRDWYISHRRAILAGRPLPDWHPPTP
jgi:hypothetical protein